MFLNLTKAVASKTPSSLLTSSMSLLSSSSNPNGAMRAEIESRTRIAERKKLNKSSFVIFPVVVVDPVVAIFLPWMSETNCLSVSNLDFFLNFFCRPGSWRRKACGRSSIACLEDAKQAWTTMITIHHWAIINEHLSQNIILEKFVAVYYKTLITKFRYLSCMQPIFILSSDKTLFFYIQCWFRYFFKFKAKNNLMNNL